MGILVGTNCDPRVADYVLISKENYFKLAFSDAKVAVIGEAFCSVLGYQVDLLIHKKILF